MANKLISELTNLATVANADEVEVQKSGEVVTKKATVEAITKVERDARKAQDDAIELGVGLDTDGNYDTPSGTNHLDSTTDVMTALVALDSALGSSSAAIITEIITVASASLNSAGTTPYELIAAPGATRWIEIIACSARLNYVSSVVVVSGKPVLEYDTGSSHFMEWANAFIVSSADIIAKGTWTSETEIILNKGVQLTFDDSTNPTGGNSGLKIALTYRIWDYADV